MRRQSEFSDSQGVSSRAWLYAGALAVGFWVASMADFDTVPPTEAGTSASPAGEAVVAADDSSRAVVASTEQRGALRAVTLEAGTPRIGARAP